MDLDMAHSIEVFTISASTNPENSVKNVMPLQVDFAKFPILSRDEGNKLRRPVRPIDRQRMRPWLMELLDLGNVFGLRWTNRHQGIFQISWKHASRLGWNLETDGDVFERWARHTGIYKEGDPPEPKRWKANFRCALHSLHDVVELTNAVERRGRNACRTYRFLQSNDEQNALRKRAKARRAKELQEQPQQKCLKETIPMISESGSGEDIMSETESEASHQDKVIVQKLDMKPDMPGEDFCLHHDHDYAGPDKTQKTIVLRQGVGSIVLCKEVQDAPETVDEAESLLMSNLDQLASAAVNSAGIESVHLQESDSDSTDGKTSMSIQSVVGIPEASLLEDSELKEPDFSLKHLLMGKSVLGDNAVCSGKSTRKRKSLALVNEPVNVSLAESESSTSHLIKSWSSANVCPQEKMKFESSKEQPQYLSPSTPVRQRTGSPKILCRRSKRNRTRSEKSMSEPTEPLMSSCLLLLEAATRLDNAEKTGMPSSSKSITGDLNVKEIPEGHSPEFSGIGKLKHSNRFTAKVDFCAHISPPSSELQCGKQPSDLNQAKFSSHMTSFGILRTTLENAHRVIEYGDNLPKSKTIKHLLKESGKAEIINAVSSSKGKAIVTEAPFATGLFSGSKIESKYPLSLCWNNAGKDRESIRLSKGRLLVHEQSEVGSESTNASESDRKVKHIVSETLLSCTPNMSTLKSSSGVQQVVIQRALPVLNNSLKRIVTSRLDTLPPVVIAQTISDSGHSPQICVSAGSSSLEPTPQVNSSSQECVVLTSDVHDVKEKFSSLPPPSSSASSINRLMEQPFLPFYSNEKMHMLDNSGATLFPVLDSQSVSFSSVSETKTMKSLQSSIGCNTVSPDPGLKIVMCTAASCLPEFSVASGVTPLKVLPVYSQAEISVSAKSKTLVSLRSAEGQNVIPIKTANVEHSNYVFANSSTVSTDPPLLATQEKGIFIFEPEKNVISEIKLHVLPLASSSYAFTKIQKEIRNAPYADIHSCKRLQSIPDASIPNESKEEHLQSSSSSLLPSILHSKVRKVSLLPRRYQHSTTYDAPTLENEEPAVPVIINGSTFTVNGAALSNIMKPGTLDEIPLLDRKSYGCELMMEVHTPSVISSNVTHYAGKVTQSDINSNGGAENLLHCSSDASLQDHASVILDCQQAHKDKDKALQKQDSLSFLHTDQSERVKSLAELCKRYLAHIFSTLDNQTSESDENDSVIESPKLELKDEIQEMKGMVQAVTVQPKLGCLKLEAISQDCKDIFQHSGCNVPCLSGLEFQSQGTTSPDLVATKKGLIYTVSNTVKNVLENSPEATSSMLSQNIVRQDLVCKELPVIVSPSTNIVVNSSVAATAGESFVKYDCKLIMDPTTPISIGEIPLFASSKGDS